MSSGKSSSLTDFDATTKSSCDTTDSSGGLSPLVDLSGSTIDSDALDSLNLGQSVRSGDDDLSEYLKNWMPPSGDEEQEPKVYSKYCLFFCFVFLKREMFYLTTHSTHFIYGYMASDIWLRTILIVRKETRCRHIGYSY